MHATTFRVFVALLVTGFLTGSQCAFVAWSGGDARDEDEEDEGLIIVIRDGRFVDAAVEGLRYSSGAVSGVTGPGGEFRYQSDSAVRFSIGDVVLGEAPRGKALLTPVDLVEGGTLDHPAVINIARLLQSLDATPGDAAISIPPRMHRRASRSNAALTGVIEFLDYGDDTRFVNAASQLLAVLTQDYPFTAVLVDADSARAHLAKHLDK